MSDDRMLLTELVAAARRAGADTADAILAGNVSVGVTVRNGKTDSVERAESRDLGLRVFVGQRSAIVSATRLEPKRFMELAERAVAMARTLPEDRFAGLSGATGEMNAAGLDLADDAEPDVGALTDTECPVRA